MLKLKDHIELVVDDDPKKQGLFMPGSRLPIRGSSALKENGIRVCLSALSPEAEQKIARRHPGFFAGGGRMVSILPRRDNSLPI